jgi:hypothetical protein
MVRRKHAESIVDDALEAIEAGRISVEDILIGGAAHSPKFRAWLSQRLKRLPVKHHGTPVLRHPTEEHAVVQQILESARREYEKREGLLHVTWGARTVDGKRVPEHAVILIVDPDRKKDWQSLPEVLHAKTSAGVRAVPLVVRPRAHGRLHAGPVQPGFHCGVNSNGTQGALGCVTLVGGQSYAIVSGHVATTQGLSVQATTASGSSVALGTTVKVRNDSDVDAARVGPVTTGIGELVDSATSLRDLQVTDTLLAIRIAVPRSPGTVFAAVEVVSEPATFLDPMTGTTQQMNGLIRLDQALTAHGDSGSPAFDMTGLLVGFVEGVADNRTYLMPARRAIDGVT